MTYKRSFEVKLGSNGRIRVKSAGLIEMYPISTIYFHISSTVMGRLSINSLNLGKSEEYSSEHAWNVTMGDKTIVRNGKSFDFNRKRQAQYCPTRIQKVSKCPVIVRQSQQHWKRLKKLQRKREKFLSINFHLIIILMDPSF